MKLNYFPDTDTLYIDLSDAPSVESEAFNESLVVDFDAEGKPVGITIEGYSTTVTSGDIEVAVPAEAPFRLISAVSG
jgi:uncharacterized protein YuzE